VNWCAQKNGLQCPCLENTLEWLVSRKELIYLWANKERTQKNMCSRIQRVIYCIKHDAIDHKNIISGKLYSLSKVFSLFYGHTHTTITRPVWILELFPCVFPQNGIRKSEGATFLVCYSQTACAGSKIGISIERPLLSKKTASFLRSLRPRSLCFLGHATIVLCMGYFTVD